MTLLHNKAAIVTGGGSGIGEATALLFAAEGAQVVVADIRLDAARATTATITASGGTAVAVHADVTQAHDVQAMIQTAVHSYGGLDILFNNAGIGVQGNAVELTEEMWDRVMALNLTGVFGLLSPVPGPRSSGRATCAVRNPQSAAARRS